MPSPFPGMDPFIEGQKWPDFHHGIIEDIRTVLMPQVRPRYTVDVEVHVYVDYEPKAERILIQPDAMLLTAEHGSAPSSGGVAVATATTIKPVLIAAPIPEERRVAFLTVRERATRELVTTIEVLSPINKRSGGPGRRKYLRKRDAVLQSAAHLIEMDLLRGGRRLPMEEPLPSGDFYVFVSREWQRPQVEVYAWPLPHPLPSVPVPLTGSDPDVTLDLQAIFNTVYDRAGYDYSLDYRRAVEPPLKDAEAAWVEKRLLAQPPEGAAGPAPKPDKA